MNLECPLFAPWPRIARTFERIMTRHDIQINEQLNVAPVIRTLRSVCTKQIKTECIVRTYPYNKK